MRRRCLGQSGFQREMTVALSQTEIVRIKHMCRGNQQFILDRRPVDPGAHRGQQRIERAREIEKDRQHLRRRKLAMPHQIRK